MKVGDVLLDEKLNEVKIESIKKVKAQNSVQVYNIEVEGEHNYYANGLLVHNKLSYNPPAVSGVPVTSGVMTNYVGSLAEETKGTWVNKVFLGSMQIATVSSDAVRYYFQDHLGSANAVTDSAGTLIELMEYKPFGDFSRHNKYGGNENVAWYYFTGKPLDDETGLMFYGARYYSPLLGRFITPDTIVQSPMNPQTLNRYSYCNNNPINLVDPSGHSWKSFWKKFGDFISPLGRAIVTGDWANFGWQVLNVVTFVFAPNAWLKASAALAYTSRATSHIGGNVADEISRVLGYAGIAAGVIGTGVQIHDAWQAAHAASGTNAIGVDKLAGQLADDPGFHFADSIVQLNQEPNILEKVNQVQQVVHNANQSVTLKELLEEAKFANDVIGMSGLALMLTPAAPVGLGIVGGSGLVGLGLGMTQGALNGNPWQFIGAVGEHYGGKIIGRFAVGLSKLKEVQFNPGAWRHINETGRFVTNIYGRASSGVQQAAESLFSSALKVISGSQ